MKREQIYEFPIIAPLTPAKRKIIGKHIVKLGEAAEKPLTYEWNDDERPVLQIRVEPIFLEINFGQSIVTVSLTAPLWARVLFNKKRRQEFRETIEDILQQAKLTPAEEMQPRKAVGTPRSKAIEKKKIGAAQRKLA